MPKNFYNPALMLSPFAYAYFSLTRDENNFITEPTLIESNEHFNKLFYNSSVNPNNGSGFFKFSLFMESLLKEIKEKTFPFNFIFKFSATDSEAKLNFNIWSVEQNFFILLQTELKDTNAQININERLFKNIVDSINDSVLYVDCNGKLIYANNEAIHNSGYSNFNDFSKNFNFNSFNKEFDVLNENKETIDLRNPSLPNIFRQTKNFEENFYYKHKSNEKFVHSKITSIPVYNEQNKLTHHIFVIHNLNETSIAEDTKSAHSKQDLINSSQDLMFLINTQGILIEVNNSALSFLNIFDQDIIGKSLFSYLPSELKKQLQLKLRSLLNNKSKEIFEIPIKNNYFKFQLYPVLSETNEIHFIAIYGQDISLEKFNENLFNKTKELLKETEAITKVGGWEYDCNEKTLTWTDEVYSIHGLDPKNTILNTEEKINLSISCYEPSMQTEIAEAFIHCVEIGKPYDIESPFTKVTGEKIWIRTQAKAIYDGDKISKVRGNILDITEKKNLEQKLQESESIVRKKLDVILDPDIDLTDLKLKDIIETEEIQKLMDHFYNLTKAGVGIIDMDGNILVKTGWQDICTKFHRQNKSTLENCIESDRFLSELDSNEPYKKYKCKNGLWDLSAPIVLNGNHIGNIFLGQFLFEDETPDYEFFRKQAEKYGFDVDEYIKALDSIPKWNKEFVHNIMLFYAQLSSIISLLSFTKIKLAKALTEKERATKELEKFKAFSDNANYGAIIVDSKYVVKYANQAFARMFYYNLDDVVEKPLSKLFPKEEFNKICGFFEKIKNDEYLITQEFAHRRFNGTEFSSLMNVNSIFDKNSNELFFSLTFTDITDRKNAELEIQKMNQKLKDSNATKDKFFSIIAHDLKSPLANIFSLSEILMEKAQETKDNETIRFSNHIYNSTNHILKLLDNLLEWARIQQGKVEFKPRQILLHNMVKNIIELYYEKTLQKRIKLINLVDQQTIIFADEAMLNTILRNLISNAMKYSHPDSIVYIESKLNFDNIQILVKDSGIGIQPEIIENLFKPGADVTCNGTLGEKGTGIGLLLCKEFVERHSGQIWVESKPNLGSTFIVSFPSKYFNQL